QIVGNVHANGRIAARPGFLIRDGHAFFDGCGVMCADFGANAIFERRDDFSTGGIVFGVRGKDEKDIEGKANWVALNLDLAFLHDVEQAYLNFSGEVGEFVDGEDTAIGARKKAVVDGEFIGEVAATAGGADGIDVADDVGDGDVGRGEFFDVAEVARHPA